MYNEINNQVLLNEIKKMCMLLSKYDKSSFNSQATDAEIIKFEQSCGLKIPDDLKSIYKIANGFQILGRTAHIYSLSDIGYKSQDVPEEYVIFGEIVGDGEKLCFHEKTGEILTVHNGRVFRYSVRGLLEYCIDQCIDGFFMSKVDIQACSVLNTDILKDIQKIYSIKSVTLGELADIFLKSDNAQREVYMSGLPVIIKAAIFGAIDNSQCIEYVKYLQTQGNEKADNLIRGMRRRAIDNFFNRERKYLDDGESSYTWIVPQMREIYNFDDNGMSYQNAGIVYKYDFGGQKVVNVIFNRSGESKVVEKKIDISYLYDVYTYLKYAGNMNNIKLEGCYGR